MSGALPYAATPLFSLMALVTSLHGDVTAHVLCMGGAWWNGMPAMYLLMAGIHLAPWLRLLGGVTSPSWPARLFRRTM